MPDIGPTGRCSQRRTSAVRAGSESDSNGSRRSIRRRLVRSSSITMSRPMCVGTRSNRSRTMPGNSRALTSRRRCSSSAEAIDVLISMATAAPVPACSPTRSIDPRSPYTENVTSDNTAHPYARSIAAAVALTCAWSRSSSRSTSPPRHRGETSMRASTAANSRRTVAIDNVSRCPRSARETVAVETPVVAAKSDCRNPALRRRLRSTCPVRRSSMRRVCRRLLTWQLSTVRGCGRRRGRGPGSVGPGSGARGP